MSAYQIMLTKIHDSYNDLTLYELMFKANFALLKDEDIKPQDRNYIVNRFLDGVSSQNTINRFHKGVNAPLKENGDTRKMYPIYYIPPYDNGKKYVTVSAITPHTQILSSNSYELEILRLLAIFANDNEYVKQMLEKTKQRLLTTCFGNFCDLGECFESSIVVLRFISIAFPGEIEWMERLINGIRQHLFDKKRPSGVLFYYWLTLSELPIELAKPEIEHFSIKCDLTTERFALQNLMKKSFVMNSNHDKYASPFGMYVLRNCLARIDEYAYIRNKKPYVTEKDGRVHFDL
jgi:hypothetical protein